MALKRIQDLDPAAPLDGSEIVEMEQAGASVRCTAQDIADLGGGGGGIPDAPSDGSLYGRKDGDWEQVTGGGGADSYTIVTEASAFTAAPGTHDGLTRYIRAGGDVTFDNAEPYTAGMAFNIRATAAVELIEDGVTLTPPAGGTLDLVAGMAVQVVMTSSTAGDVIGQTVAA